MSAKPDVNTNGRLAVAQPFGERQGRDAGQHQVDDRHVEAVERAVRFQPVQIALDDDVRGAVVAAQLLDIHRDQGFVLEDEDTQSGKYVIHQTACSNGGH